MIISEEQAKQIARTIAFDIKQFIVEHQIEYDLYLKDKTKKVHDDGEDATREVDTARKEKGGNYV